MRLIFPAIILILTLGACTGPQDESGFDRPALLQGVEASIADQLRAADRHILVVRHALKVSDDCNALDCPLSPAGEAMVVRLAGLIGTPAMDQAYASAACRTLRTAEAGGSAVTVHQAADGLQTGCTADDVVTRSRADAFAEAAASDARWTLVAEHSNTSCLWLTEFAGEAAAQAGGCADGHLADTAYGDIFWLYRLDDAWHLTVLPAAFEAATAE